MNDTFLTPSQEPQFTQALPALTTSSVAHPDTWNPVHQMLLDNTEHLRLRANGADEAVGALQSRIEGVEKISAVDVSRSVSLDWLYRGNRIAIEFFSDATTLVAHAGVAVVRDTAGGDRPDRRALVLVENLSVPFDRRVWQECTTLR
ncbi:hypothetical protein ACPF8X_43695, partial [Streptomyces sp. G35A]